MIDFFKTRLVGEKIWSINGPTNDQMYLVMGSQRAMLVDTGMGIGDLGALVRGLTDLPVMVINTHGHPDHAGGNPNFAEIWMPAQDEKIMREMCSDEFRLKDIKAVLGQENRAYEDLVAGMVKFKPFKINHLEAGQVIDLGDRQFEVLEISGHTPGSVGLISPIEKLLFSGDSIVSTPVWMYLAHSLSMKKYWESLKRLHERRHEFDTIFAGHQPTPLDLDALSELLACSEEILSNPGIGEPTQTFAGKGLCWIHGKHQIIYDPQKVDE